LFWFHSPFLDKAWKKLAGSSPFDDMKSESSQMKRKIIYMAGAFLLSLGWTACGDGSAGDTAAISASVSVSISIPSTQSKEGLQAPQMAPAPTAVNSITIEASGSDFSTLAKTLVRDTHFTSGTDPVIAEIMVPIGSDRTFTAQAYSSFNGTGIPLYKGSTTGVTLVVGTNKVQGIFLFVPPFALPTISGVTPIPVCPGSPLTIAGTNFDPISANNTVFFEGGNAPNDDRYGVVTNATSVELTVTVVTGTKNGNMFVHNLIGTSTPQFVNIKC
jgi:hypothetical protein